MSLVLLFDEYYEDDLDYEALTGLDCFTGVLLRGRKLCFFLGGEMNVSYDVFKLEDVLGFSTLFNAL